MAKDGSFIDLKEKVKVSADKALDVLKIVLSTGTEVVKNFAGTIITKFSDLGKSIVTKILNLSSTFIGVFSEMGKSSINGVVDFVKKYSTNLALVRQSTDLTKGNTCELIDTFEKQMKTLSDSSNTLGSSIFVGIQKPLQELSQLGIEAIAELQKGFDQGGLESMAACAGNVIVNLMNGFAEQLPVLTEFASSILNAILEGIVNNSDTITAGTTMVISQLIESLITLLPLIGEFALQLLTVLFTGFSENIDAIYEGATVLMTTFITALSELLPLIGEFALQILIALFTGISENIDTISEGALMLVTTLLSAIAELLPTLTESGVTLLNTLMQGILDNMSRITEDAATIILTLTMAILELMPSVVECGMQLVIGLCNGLLEQAPEFTPTVLSLIGQLVDNFVQNLPELFKTGMLLIKELVNGLVNAIPDIIAYIPVLVDTFCTILRENLPEFIESGVKLIGALVIGLIQAIPDLIAAIPDIISAIWDGITSVDWIDLGMNIVDGIISGLGNLGGKILGAIGDIGESIFGGFCDFFDIGSPSKLMRDKIGKMIPMGLEVGVEAQLPKSVKSMTSATAREMEKFKNATLGLTTNDFDAFSLNSASSTGSVNLPTKLEIIDKSQNQTSLVLDNGQEIAHWLTPWISRELGFTKG